MSRHSSRLKNTVCGMKEHQTRYVTMQRFFNINYCITWSKTQISAELLCDMIMLPGSGRGEEVNPLSITQFALHPCQITEIPLMLGYPEIKPSSHRARVNHNMQIAKIRSVQCTAHKFPLLDTRWRKRHLQITLTLESTTFPLNAIACCCTCCFIARICRVAARLCTKPANPPRWVGGWLHLAANQRHNPARSPLLRTRFTSSQAAFVGPNKSLSRGCTWQVGNRWVAVNITAIFVVWVIKATANRWVNSTKDM